MELGFMSTEVRLPNCSKVWFILTLSAFGIFARVLPEEDDYQTLHKRMEGIELADSITVDGHKLLNVVSSSNLQPFAHDLTYM